MQTRVDFGVRKPQWDGSLPDLNSLDFLAALRSKRHSSKKAFRQLVFLTHTKLSRFLGRYLNSKEQIQDALQETYLGVFRGLPRFAGKCRLSTWIYSLAYRKACDCLARQYRQASRNIHLEGESETWEPEGNDFLAPDEALHQSHLVQTILSAAQELPKIYLDAYQLRDLDGLSSEEAAEILGISDLLIRVRLHRARALIVAKLRKKLPCMFLGVNAV